MGRECAACGMMGDGQSDTVVVMMMMVMMVMMTITTATNHLQNASLSSLSWAQLRYD
jgi:hypothetical protein